MDKKQIKYFIYTRKSSEDSNRQVASIQDQKDTNDKIIKNEGLTLVETYSEEKTAFVPGRPIFNEMMDRIQRGEANAILCWDYDRLSRNPIDSGKIMWMLQNSVIKLVRTPGRTFYPEDAGLLMSIESGRSTDYSMRLSKNVRRGLKSRIAKGWRPNLAPIGYLNKGVKGEKTIIKDERTFEIVRKMWDLLLTGSYSVTSILDIANNKWGLRTTVRTKLGGKPFSHAQIYKMFNDTFYYGYFWIKNNETGEKELIKGSHQHMITEREYWRAQVLLGRKGKPQPKTRQFYCTGLIKCGECNGTVTAEEKHQLICTKCKNKFAYEGRTSCPKCKIDISEMNNPKILHYTYIHCTKRPVKTCSQGSIRLEDLESQFSEVLAGLKIDEEYLQIALDYLKERQSNSPVEEKRLRESLQTTYDSVQARITRLQKEYTSAQNVNHDLYTPEEYIAEKKSLQQERQNIERELNDVKTKFDESIEATERTFNFCTFAQIHFNTGDVQKKREIFSTIGSNLTLKDKKLSIERLHPYLLIENELKAQKVLMDTLEPKKRSSNKRKEAVFAASSLTWRRR